MFRSGNRHVRKLFRLCREMIDGDGSQQNAAFYHVLPVDRDIRAGSANVVTTDSSAIPRMAPRIVPEPPLSDAPPITAAAMMLSSMPDAEGRGRSTKARHVDDAGKTRQTWSRARSPRISPGLS